MLNMFNQNISLDGQSMINGEVVATMNMSVNGTDDTMNGAYFNMSVMDMKKFMDNKTDVIADFSTFCDKAVALIADVEDGPDAE